LARPIRDVGSAGRRESVAEARCKCGFGETSQLALVKDSSVPRTERPSEGTPKGGTHVLATCVTPGQLDDCVALALQQHGQQSALRKRKGRGEFSHNVVAFCFSCPKVGQFSQGFRSFLRQVRYKSRWAFAREGPTPRTRSAIFVADARLKLQN
jgi:hypothetical protein